MASRYPIGVRSRGRLFAEGHQWARGIASFARALSRKCCELPRASLPGPGPGQSDFGRIDISAVKDPLGSMHWNVDRCPIAMQLKKPAAVEMTGVPAPCGSSMASRYPIGVRSRGRLFAEGHLWARGIASFARALSRKCCELPRASPAPVRPRSATSCELSTSIPERSGLLLRRIVGLPFVFFPEQNSPSPLR